MLSELLAWRPPTWKQAATWQGWGLQRKSKLALKVSEKAYLSSCQDLKENGKVAIF